MAAGGMAGGIERVGIAAEAAGVSVDPGDRTPHLIDHRKEIAAGFEHIDEVRNDAMRARLHERLGQIGAVG
jgi:hypothetical protein